MKQIWSQNDENNKPQMIILSSDSSELELLYLKCSNVVLPFYSLFSHTAFIFFDQGNGF